MLYDYNFIVLILICYHFITIEITRTAFVIVISDTANMYAYTHLIL
jgi:hypothetical protein